jgi:hypothetical protein
MVAAEQNGQPMVGELAVHRIVHLEIPRRHLRQIAIAVRFDESGIRRPADIAAIHHIQAALRQRRV